MNEKKVCEWWLHSKPYSESWWLEHDSRFYLRRMRMKRREKGIEK